MKISKELYAEIRAQRDILNGSKYAALRSVDFLDALIDQMEQQLRIMPRIVCLCGSTRFWREFQKASLRETIEGRIVLSIGAASGTDDDHFGNLPHEEYDRIKAQLDELHKRKIDLADEVLVLNVGGYIGESTRSEIDYAIAHNKPVRYLEPIEQSLESGVGVQA